MSGFAPWGDRFSGKFEPGGLALIQAAWRNAMKADWIARIMQREN